MSDVAPSSAGLAAFAAANATPVSTAQLASTSSAKPKPKKALMYRGENFWEVVGAIILFLTLLNMISIFSRRIKARRLSLFSSSVQRSSLPRWLGAASSARNIVHLTTAPRWAYEMSVNEIAWTAAYILLSLVLGLWGINANPKSFANQIGYIAFAQVPLIIGLAGKNNVISYLTGISYEKLNFLHRAAGRVCLLCSWIHTYGRLKVGLNKKTAIDLPYMIAGVVAITCLTLLTLGSFRWMRAKFYEAFLLSHILLVLGFIIGAWCHWSEFYWWLLAGIVIWSFDRVARLLRHILINQLWLLSKSLRNSRGLRDATIELVDRDTLRLTIRRTLFTWSAGQHAYLVIPAVSVLPFEAHPFTMVNLPKSSMTSSAEKVEEGQIRAENGKEIVFLMRVRDGFTRRLAHYCQRDQTSSELSVFIEGPYGSAPTFEHYTSNVFLAGGTGISFAFANFCQAIENSKARTKTVGSESNSDLTRLVWVVRDASAIQWILPLLARYREYILGHMNVRIDVFVTRSRGKSNTSDEKYSLTPDSEKTSASTSPSESVVTLAHHPEQRKPSDRQMISHDGIIQWHDGRPNLTELIGSIQEESPSEMSLSVCGPSSLQADTRRAVKTLTGLKANASEKRANIQYHAETFGW